MRRKLRLALVGWQNAPGICGIPGFIVRNRRACFLCGTVLAGRPPLRGRRMARADGAVDGAAAHCEHWIDRHLSRSWRRGRLLPWVRQRLPVDAIARQGSLTRVICRSFRVLYGSRFSGFAFSRLLRYNSISISSHPLHQPHRSGIHEKNDRHPRARGRGQDDIL